MLAPFVNLFIRLGISPDAVTLVGTARRERRRPGLLPQGELLTGVLVITAFVFSDLIDGAMARASGTHARSSGRSSTPRSTGSATPRSSAGLVLYFAGPGDSYLYLCLTLYCLVMGAVTSYARARAESLGMEAKGGIAERADRLVAILVATGLSELFDLPILMYVTHLGARARQHRDRRAAHPDGAQAGAGSRPIPPPATRPDPVPTGGRVPPYDSAMADTHVLDPASSPSTGTSRVKRGMAEMLKGGVIMDVVTAEQAKIAEDAGAVAVMALERVPADIRAQGGVSRMSDPDMIDGIIEAVSIPVMAKARIGHFAEAQVLQSLGVDYVDESEVLTPADYANHIDKWAFTVPFVCGATNLGEALRRITEGAAMIRSKGEAGTGDVSNAVTHMRTIRREIRRLGVALRRTSCTSPRRSCRRRTTWSRRSPRAASCPSCCSPPAASPPRPTPR